MIYWIQLVYSNNRSVGTITLVQLAKYVYVYSSYFGSVLLLEVLHWSMLQFAMCICVYSDVWYLTRAG